jgi:hypothetical protein
LDFRCLSSFFQRVAEDDDPVANGQLNFSVVYEETQWFQVEPLEEGGKTAEVRTLLEIDREALLLSRPRDVLVLGGNSLKFRLTVKVEDEGQPPLSTNCFMLVDVIDANDNKPIFDQNAYSTQILRTISPTKRVIRVFALDDDAGQNAQVSYSIQEVSPSCENCFTIETESGWIRKGSGALSVSLILRSSALLNLSLLQGGPYNLIVQAIDPDPTHGVTVTVTVSVTDSLANLPPVWDLIDNVAIDDMAPIEILENTPSSTNFEILFNATATGNQISYYNVRGRVPSTNKDRNFDYREYDRAMQLFNLALDYETTNKYILHLRSTVSISIF